MVQAKDKHTALWTYGTVAAGAGAFGWLAFGAKGALVLGVGAPVAFGLLVRSIMKGFQ